MHPDKPGGSKTAFQETVRFSDEVSGQLRSICSFRYFFNLFYEYEDETEDVTV